MMEQFSLDFDDAYQYGAAEKYNLTNLSHPKSKGLFSEALRRKVETLRVAIIHFFQY
jgi:hypothetical protein